MPLMPRKSICFLVCFVVVVVVVVVVVSVEVFFFAVLAFLSSFVGKLGHTCKCVFCKGCSIVVRLVS